MCCIRTSKWKREKKKICVRISTLTSWLQAEIIYCWYHVISPQYRSVKKWHQYKYTIHSCHFFFFSVVVVFILFFFLQFIKSMLQRRGLQNNASSPSSTGTSARFANVGRPLYWNVPLKPGWKSGQRILWWSFSIIQRSHLKLCARTILSVLLYALVYIIAVSVWLI